MVNELPEECVFKILFSMSPLTAKDACRAALISTVFQKAVDSEFLWEKLLPPDYEVLISQSRNFPVETLKSMSKKHLYFHLCDNPIDIDDGHLQHSLDKPTGKKCFLVKAPRFTPSYGSFSEISQLLWKSPALGNPEMAGLNLPFNDSYRANLDSRVLSEKTKYVPYFVFNHTNRVERYGNGLLQLGLNFKGNGNMDSDDDDDDDDGPALITPVDPRSNALAPIRDRKDGRKEIELYDFHIRKGESGSILCMMEDNMPARRNMPGIKFEGIELRPEA